MKLLLHLFDLLGGQRVKLQVGPFSDCSVLTLLILLEGLDRVVVGFFLGVAHREDGAHCANSDDRRDPKNYNALLRHAGFYAERCA